MEKEIITFEDAFRKTSSLIYSVAYRLTGVEEEARDLTQETFIKAWNKWHQCKDKKKPIPWLRRICTNLFLDKKRTEKPAISVEELEEEGESLPLVSPLPTPEQEAEADRVIRQVKDYCFTAISTKLPPYQRIAFVMVDIFGMSVADVSELLGRSALATKALLHRARENMNAFFGNRCSLIVPDNICKCKAWLSFVERSERLKETGKPDFAIDPDFSDPSYRNRSRPETLEKLISYFRSLSLLSPPQSWLDEISMILRERIQ